MTRFTSTASERDRIFVHRPSSARLGMATVTLTPSRVDPPPPYSTALARPISLQPSAMPPPPPSSVSPRRKIAMSRDLENPFLIKRERERGRAKQAGLGDELFTVRREALGNVDTNHHLLNNASTSTLTSVSRPPVPIFHTSIPKPPLVPDVFTHTGGKRPADYAPGESRKRRALDDVRVQDQRAAKESDQERWRNKWIKSFPTLTFHFDVGAQEGPGRLLKARTTKMGAVSRPFCQFDDPSLDERRRTDDRSVESRTIFLHKSHTSHRQERHVAVQAETRECTITPKFAQESLL